MFLVSFHFCQLVLTGDPAVRLPGGWGLGLNPVTKYQHKRPNNQGGWEHGLDPVNNTNLTVASGLEQGIDPVTKYKHVNILFMDP